MKTLEHTCPLCHSKSTTLYFKDKKRSYSSCKDCRLVFVPDQFHLTPEAEKAEYDLHQNDPEDSGYLQFLSRLTTPLTERLPAEQHGLDFGSGPGPAIAGLMAQHGHRVSNYDPFFAPDQVLLKQQYDFICSTEVVEHFRIPAQEWQQLWTLLKPGGILAIMTKLVLDQQRFKNWHYIRDLTHVSFYSVETCAWLAQIFGAEFERIDRDVVFFYKQI